MDSTIHWEQLLARPDEGNHIVQVYQDIEFLVEAVSHFAGRGLARREAVILIATKPHQEAFERYLSADNFDVQSAKQEGQLIWLDAEETLSKLMVNGMPEQKVFERLMGGLLQETRKSFFKTRIYGEMVNILCQQGNSRGAALIEEFWNDLQKIHPFALLCGYVLDNFDKKSYNGTLQEVCRSHSHLIPAKDYACLEDAVQKASHETLGASLTTMSQVFFSQQSFSTKMPAAQAALIWLQENMPVTAEKVFSRARKYYKAAVQKPSSRLLPLG